MKEYIEKEIFKGTKYSILKLIKVVSFDINLRFIFLLRTQFWLKQKKKYFIMSFVNRRLVTKYGCFIGTRSSIGIGIQFPHPNGIIIGADTIIGKNCIIFQQVTIGGKEIGDAQKGNYPIIGDNVIIYSGAKLIGNISIGNNVIIGANSVVNKNIPDYSVVAGCPAKIIKIIPH